MCPEKKWVEKSKARGTDADRKRKGWKITLVIFGQVTLLRVLKKNFCNIKWKGLVVAKNTSVHSYNIFQYYTEEGYPPSVCVCFVKIK